MTTWKMMSFQDSSSPIMEQMIFFHDHSMMILIMIITMVMYMLSCTLINKMTNMQLMENQMMEFIWTMIPAITLIFIALPSLHLLYMMDELTNPLITIKSIGHQWYWSYEYSDFNNIEFESYMKMEDTKKSDMRLLEVDNRIILPTNTQIRILISSTDVIHSWTIPSLGIKMDAIPGRLNQSSIYINRTGIMYGQCSEICGINHSFMPIMLEVIPIEHFMKWLTNNLHN